MYYIAFPEKKTEKSDNIILINELSGQEIPETQTHIEANSHVIVKIVP